VPRYYFNKGDLLQMIDQARFLRNHRFDIEDADIYATVGSKEEYVIGIKAIYESRVIGWWNYRDDLINNGICNAEEFKENLRKSVRREK
jgi:hypothetical protein